MFFFALLKTTQSFAEFRSSKLSAILSAAKKNGGGGGRTPMGVNPPVFKTGALPVRLALPGTKIITDNQNVREPNR